MKIAADLKLGNNVSMQEKNSRVRHDIYDDLI